LRHSDIFTNDRGAVYAQEVLLNGPEGESFIIWDTPGIADTRNIDSSHIKPLVASLKKNSQTDE
jgi:predicted GTPase